MGTTRSCLMLTHSLGVDFFIPTDRNQAEDSVWGLEFRKSAFVGYWSQLLYCFGS